MQLPDDLIRIVFKLSHPCLPAKLQKDIRDYHEEPFFDMKCPKCRRQLRLPYRPPLVRSLLGFIPRMRLFWKICKCGMMVRLHNARHDNYTMMDMLHFIRDDNNIIICRTERGRIRVISGLKKKSKRKSRARREMIDFTDELEEIDEIMLGQGVANGLVSLFGGRRERSPPED